MATDSEPVGALTHRKAFLLHYGHGVDGRVNIWVNSWLAVVPHMAGFGGSTDFLPICCCCP